MPRSARLVLNHANLRQRRCFRWPPPFLSAWKHFSFPPQSRHELLARLRRASKRAGELRTGPLQVNCCSVQIRVTRGHQAISAGRRKLFLLYQMLKEGELPCQTRREGSSSRPGPAFGPWGFAAEAPLNSGLCLLDKATRLPSCSGSAAAHPSSLSRRVRVKLCQEAWGWGGPRRLSARPHCSGPVSPPTRATSQPLGLFGTPPHL